MPGTFVAIGLNSPRISAGASVLISQVSWCGGPPPRKMLITALCEDRVPARASARNKSARDNDIRPPIERPPIRMKSRRRSLSQNEEVSLDPKIVSIRLPLAKSPASIRFDSMYCNSLTVPPQGVNPTGRFASMVATTARRFGVGLARFS